MQSNKSQESTCIMLLFTIKSIVKGGVRDFSKDRPNWIYKQYTVVFKKKTAYSNKQETKEKCLKNITRRENSSDKWS